MAYNNLGRKEAVLACLSALEKIKLAPFYGRRDVAGGRSTLKIIFSSSAGAALAACGSILRIHVSTCREQPWIECDREEPFPWSKSISCDRSTCGKFNLWLPASSLLHSNPRL